MNILAVFLAALSSFLLGGLWYSPALFGRMWNAENGGEKQAGHPAKVFGISFVFSLVAAAAFGLWLGPSPSIETALRAGLLAGVGFVACSFGITPVRPAFVQALANRCRVPHRPVPSVWSCLRSVALTPNPPVNTDARRRASPAPLAPVTFLVRRRP